MKKEKGAASLQAPRSLLLGRRIVLTHPASCLVLFVIPSGKRHPDASNSFNPNVLLRSRPEMPILRIERHSNSR